MSSGLLALLDDVVAIAKVAAASADDIAGMSAKAGTKAMGVVIDDAAVTPRYAVGFAPARELPIVWKIAKGSLRNKLLLLLPAALALSVFAPWAITPLLMVGGAYLCFEGAEKIHEMVSPHAHGDHGESGAEAPGTPEGLENARVRGAIKTDLILSAEIMAITLAALPPVAVWQQAMVLGVVAVAITALVYGAVAVIVKADDVGLALATRGRTGLGRAVGRRIVAAMPGVLSGLALIGTVAMLWVGGGILLHGLETLGLAAPAHLQHAVAEAVGHLLPAGGVAATWIVSALIAAAAGLAVGAVIVRLVGWIGPMRANRPGPGS